MLGVPVPERLYDARSRCCAYLLTHAIAHPFAHAVVLAERDAVRDGEHDAVAHLRRGPVPARERTRRGVEHMHAMRRWHVLRNDVVQRLHPMQWWFVRVLNGVNGVPAR